MGEVLSCPLSHDNEGHSQVEVCNVCGDKGFSNALLNCSECCETLVHQYCLGIPPGSIDDSFNWLCEYCCAQIESQPCSSTKSGGASTKRKEKTKKQNRERGPSLLQSEVPLTLGSKFKRIRKERTEDQSLTGTTKVAIDDCSDSKKDQNMGALLDHKMDSSSTCIVYCGNIVNETSDDEGESAMIPVGNEPEPLLMLLPIKDHQSLEEEENTRCGVDLLDCGEEPDGVLSFLMENPRELTRGVVLLVSPSGEVFIHEELDLWDEDSVEKTEEPARDIVLLGSPSGEVFIHEYSGLYDAGSGGIFKHRGPHKRKFESTPTDEDIDHFCDEVTDSCQSNVDDKMVKSMKSGGDGSTINLSESPKPQIKKL